MKNKNTPKKEGFLRRLIRSQNEHMDKKNFGARLTAEKKQRECDHEFILKNIRKGGSALGTGAGVVTGGLLLGPIGAVVGGALGGGKSEGKAWVCRKCGVFKK